MGFLLRRRSAPPDWTGACFLLSQAILTPTPDPRLTDDRDPAFLAASELSKSMLRSSGATASTSLTHPRPSSGRPPRPGPRNFMDPLRRGFSYGDVLGSAKGWAAAVRFHPEVSAELESFRRRADTFSLGVCNGCQLLAHLGWVGPEPQGVFLAGNKSGRFESRFSSVRIEAGPSLLLRGLEGAKLGIWSAHGEGRFTFDSAERLEEVESQQLVALRYVDDEGQPTTKYPWNPNGSEHGIAGMTSADGRHLALMPHPERCFLSWQWPHWPENYPQRRGVYLQAPWIRLFQNAALFASSNP